MKRKAFIKQLMAAGMSRNDAAECAALTANALRPVRLCIIHGHNTPAYRIMTAPAITLGGGGNV